MSDLMQILTQQLGGSVLEQISGSLGADKDSTGNAVAAALPVLVGALARNASQPDGAASLDRALSRDHDGSILNDLKGAVLRGGGADGDNILGHMLGSRRSTVERGLSNGTGLDTASIGKLIGMLAPVVMGALGKAKREQGFDAGGLAGMLERERVDVQRQAPAEMGILERMLDSDGDGDVEMDDVARAGFGMLGKLLKR